MRAQPGLAAQRPLLLRPARRLRRQPDPRPGVLPRRQGLPHGTVRHDLFIHTETGAGNQQCADTKGDQICRWEWPKINDYRSAGCIKMAPRDLLALTRHFHRYFDAGVRYARHRVQVKVIP
ncbi:hypothetical protein NLS1_18090 [Nocardioides sp. LS1]|nr:hypothetical protein NLS1_18090 [Nocardioides sp. LS1]